MTDREVMQQALQALEGDALDLAHTQLDQYQKMGYSAGYKPQRIAGAQNEIRAIENAIAALRERLATPAAPEAVPWVNPEVLHMAEDAECLHKCLDEAKVPRADEGEAIYSLWGRVQAFARIAAPAPRLTDAQIDAIAEQQWNPEWSSPEQDRRAFARAIEAAVLAGAVEP